MVYSMLDLFSTEWSESRSQGGSAFTVNILSCMGDLIFLFGSGGMSDFASIFEGENGPDDNVLVVVLLSVKKY